MKRVTKLTESDLHRIIRESVKRVLSEEGQYDSFKYYPEKVKNSAKDYDPSTGLPWDDEDEEDDPWMPI